MNSERERAGFFLPLPAGRGPGGGFFATAVGGRGPFRYSARDGLGRYPTTEGDDMFRLLAGAFALTLIALTAGADDKKEPKAGATTTWVRDANGIDLKFVFGADTGTFNVTAGDDGVVLKAKLTRKKDVVTAEFTDVDVKGNFPNPPKKGDKISFKWVVKDDTATLSDFTSDNEGAKDVVEGEYKRKKK